MAESTPTVSVIIPTYNRERLLPKAIESVLAQSFSDFELLIIDDGSTDNTQAVIEGFNHTQIHYIRHSNNRGECAARNTGIAMARGAYIAFLDSDDEWLPSKLAKQVALFEKMPAKVGAIYTWLKIIDGKTQLETLRKSILRGDVSQNLLYKNFIGTPSTLMIKRHCLQQTEGFDARLRCCGDWDMWLQLSCHCEFEFIPEALVQYHDHDEKGRGSKNNHAIVEGYLTFLQKHHSTLFKDCRHVGSFPHSEKAKYLFIIGRRLLCHGCAIDHNEAIQLGRQYLRLALTLSPLDGQILYHYLSSLPGKALYPQAIQWGADSKRIWEAVFR